MAETIITVQGEYELRHTAERGSVSLTVEFDGPDREEVLGHTTERQASLTSELRELHDPKAGPVVSWSAGSVRVWGDRPWSQTGEQLPVVHHAQTDLQVTFSDLAALSDWVGTISLLSGVTVQGVTWSLTDARRQTLVQEARRRAVENAVAKATVYATSLGLSTVRPVALSDPGMLGDGSAPVQPPQALFARALSDSPDASLTLKPEEIVIQVQVHARFAAS
jgi:uncharacterized protein YggE